MESMENMIKQLIKVDWSLMINANNIRRLDPLKAPAQYVLAFLIQPSVAIP